MFMSVLLEKKKKKRLLIKLHLFGLRQQMHGGGGKHRVEVGRFYFLLTECRRQYWFGEAKTIRKFRMTAKQKPENKNAGRPMTKEQGNS